MIINSITLKNFRSYEDETTFSFQPKDNKNIVLVGGENGAGKSTLFEAMKLCIYGPITYGYLGQNSNYLTKIKNNINNNAFKNEDIECYLGINLSFKDGTKIKNYYLKRSWNYVNQRVIETFKVFLDDKELNDEEMLYFDKYLKSVLPPSLFDFFFFDGEELSDFFTGKSANSNLKESILELFNYDTFEVLKKQLLSHQRAQTKSNKKIDEVRTSYEEQVAAVNEMKVVIENLKKETLENEERLEDLLSERAKTEDTFKNSGGLLEEQKAEINAEIANKENERANLNAEIKDFCNDTLPFLLVSDLLKDTKEQILDEQDLASFNSVKDKLTGEVVMNSLNIDCSSDIGIVECDMIADRLLENMFNATNLTKIKPILQLSENEKSGINHLINKILTNKGNLIKSATGKFTKITNINNDVKELREKLKSSVSEDALNTYLETMHKLNEEISKVQSTVAVNKSSLENKEAELSKLEYHLTRVKNEYSALLQNANVLDMSNSLIDYLTELLANLTKDKIRLIEEEFINIFKIIIRKDNYVNSIVIDDTFNTTLYINKEYIPNEILNVINNLGFDGVIKKYGAKFIDDLFVHYNVNTHDDLLQKINEDFSLAYITLSTKININDFSNGEKQIYILCLIWAIIKSSGVEIPFIIDTPYARIDETHRNALTTTYLPNISKQVIILSTNKEIDSELYQVVKPYVCDEYLLLYNTELRKTEIKKGYFEV